MPTLDWLRREFDYGYDSGDILADIPCDIRGTEEKRIGGCYRTVFEAAIMPHLTPGARVLEIGPGRGSWTRAILRRFPRGEVHTVDFHAVGEWIDPTPYNGRLIHHQVADLDYDGVPRAWFDFIWSFGVLCHCNREHIAHILSVTRELARPGAVAIHQYGDWNKLEAFGWESSHIDPRFKALPDDDIWWPRNDQRSMRRMAEVSGWEVVTTDMDLLKRDAMIVLKNPESVS